MIFNYKGSNNYSIMQPFSNFFLSKTQVTKRDEAYCDVMNFLDGYDRFIKEKQKFDKYSPDDKSQIRKKYRNAIEKLDKEAEFLWGYNASKGGWGNVIDFLKNNLNAKIWK